jgi:hypothetical protein
MTTRTSPPPPTLASPGPRPRLTRAVNIVVELAPLALIVVAEAAWISVVTGLLQEFSLHDPGLGIPALVPFVLAGVAVARWLGPRLGDRWPIVGLGLVVGSGAIGWLSSPLTRDAFGEGIGAALAAHPGGWFAGLALLRGFAHARIPLAEETVTNLLAIGVPGLAVAATLGGLIVDPFRTRFLDDSLVAAIVFVAAAVLALALTRLDAIGTDAGFDWRRNPPWLLLAIAMIVVAIVIAIPLASVAGTVITLIVSVALWPMLIVGLATGFDQAVRRLFALGALVLVVLFVLVRLFGRVVDLPTQGGGGDAGTAPPPEPAEHVFTIGIGGLLLLGAIVGIIVLIALWMRKTPAPEGLVAETRTIDASDDGLARVRRRGRFGSRPAPTTAAQAYVALVEDLERHPDVRRGPAETPSAHAARLRASGRAGLSLDLLAADYALARYGGVALPEHEDRRAVGRWRGLRRRLASGPTGRPGAGRGGRSPAREAELPPGLDLRRPS